MYDPDFEFSKTDTRYPTSEYCFCGLVSLEDPPKHGVREAIGTLRLAGIKVMMVTGDHPKTAEAIARKINLILGETKETLSKKTGRPVDEIYEDEVDAVVIHGDDIDGLQGWQWDQSAYVSDESWGTYSSSFRAVFAKNEIVFARTSPQHKLEIGQCLPSSRCAMLTVKSCSQTRPSSRTYRRRVSTYSSRRTFRLTETT